MSLITPKTVSSNSLNIKLNILEKITDFALLAAVIFSASVSFSADNGTFHVFRYEKESKYTVGVICPVFESW